MWDEALTYLRKAVDLTDRLPVHVGWLGHALARSGATAEARALLQELGKRADMEYVPPVSRSWIAMSLGETDRALDCFDQEYGDRGVYLFAASALQAFDPLRSEPRFQALLHRMNFPEPAAAE